MIQPNLFVVGAMKSGTTSLYIGLKSHPEIYMSDCKEPGYFLPRQIHANGYFSNCATDEEALQRYLELFRPAVGYRYVGEASTWYTMSPSHGHSAAGIYAFAPTARIIYVIRDPMDRTISDYWYQFALKRENRPPLQAIRENARYCDVSYYAMQISPYLELFSPDQVLVLTLEEFSKAPQAELSRIFHWLDLDPRQACLPNNVRENVAPPQIVRIPNWLTKLRESQLYEKARLSIPTPVRTMFRNLAEQRVITSQVDMTPVKEFLRPRQQLETEELSDLLGRDFRHWKTLYDGSGTCGSSAA